MKQTLLLALLVLVSAAHAEVYRCVGDDGATTFSQTPCSDSAEKVSVSSSRPVTGPADCAYVEKFARSTGQLMRQGVDKEQLFEQFGGRGAFDDGATQIVHYVYQYRDSQDMSRDRIAERAAGRCRSGAFDGVNCQSLPSAYTDSTGGCRAAVTVQRADYNVDAFAIDREQLAERQRAQAELTRKQAEDMRKHHAQQKRAAECRKKHEQEIARIEVLIQAGSDPRSHRSKLRKLREKLAKCGPYTQVSPPEVQPQPGGYHRLRNR